MKRAVSLIAIGLLGFATLYTQEEAHAQVFPLHVAYRVARASIAAAALWYATTKPATAKPRHETPPPEDDDNNE